MTKESNELLEYYLLNCVGEFGIVYRAKYQEKTVAVNERLVNNKLIFYIKFIFE